MEKDKFSFEKISDDEKRRIESVLEKAREEGDEFEIEETPDTILIKRMGADGKAVGMGFTKVGREKILLSDGFRYHIAHIIEARMKFPDDNILDAVKKLYAGKPELQKENDTEE